MKNDLKLRDLESLIFELRGYKVMIVADLAALEYAYIAPIIFKK